MKTNVKIIKQKVMIPASPKEVYDAYTDPQKHSEFTDSKATGKPVVGGKFTAWDGYISGTFLEFEEGKRVVQEWTSTDFSEDYPPSKLELTFRAVSKGTEITMVHSNVPKDQEAETAEGWTEFYWDPMKEYFKPKTKK